MKCYKVVVLILMFQVLFLSQNGATAAQQRQTNENNHRTVIENLIQKAADDPDPYLEKLFAGLLAATEENLKNRKATGYFLMALQTNAGHMFAKYANEEVLDWLMKKPEKGASEPTLAPLLIKFCDPLPEKRFKAKNIHYDVPDKRKKGSVLMAGLALGDPAAVELIRGYLRSSDPEKVNFAKSLLRSSEYSNISGIPLELFQMALACDGKRRPVEAYLKQLFITEPPDIQKQLNQVFSEFPKTGSRLNYITGTNNILSSPTLPGLLCQSLQVNKEAFLNWAYENGYSSYSYRIASVLAHAPTPDPYFNTLIENITIEDKYRKCLLLIATGLDRPGFDAFVKFPAKDQRFYHGNLNFLYTLRCGTRETRQKYLDSLDENPDFLIDKSFLKASVAETGKDARNEIQKCIDSMKKRDHSSRRRHDNSKDKNFRLCLSHLRSEKLLDMKWQAFQQLTRSINDAKTRYMLTKDLKGSIPYSTISKVIKEKMKSDKARTSLPELKLISDDDLRLHKNNLEKRIGHFGKPAALLSTRLRKAGIEEDYIYFYFSRMD